MTRIFGIALLAAVAGIVGLAQADTHHNAHALIQGKLNQNGKHVLHATKTHTAHAHVQGGKISHVEVTHKTKGALKVSKYKSAKRHHAQAESGVEHHYVSAQGVVTAFVGFGFIDDAGVLVIYWFPVTIVVNGDAGCVAYSPGI